MCPHTSLTLVSPASTAFLAQKRLSQHETSSLICKRQPASLTTTSASLCYHLPRVYQLDTRTVMILSTSPVPVVQRTIQKVRVRRPRLSGCSPLPHSMTCLELCIRMSLSHYAMPLTLYPCATANSTPDPDYYKYLLTHTTTSTIKSTPCPNFCVRRSAWQLGLLTWAKIIIKIIFVGAEWSNLLLKSACFSSEIERAKVRSRFAKTLRKTSDVRTSFTLYQVPGSMFLGCRYSTHFATVQNPYTCTGIFCMIKKTQKQEC